MAQYRISEIDLSTRIVLATEMIMPIPLRPWGRAKELADTHGVSRRFLYELRQAALAGLLQALAPHDPGPRPLEKVLVIDKAFLRRAITVLPLLKGSIRDIQLGLELLFQVQRSVGYISETLQGSGLAAAAYNASIVIPLPVLGEADEIFQGRRPCLTVVDGRSFLVLHLSPADARDKTTWGLTFLALQERGIQFHDLACDGAKGIRSGVEEANLKVPLRPDLFHLVQEGYRLRQRLLREAYAAMEVAERARRAKRESEAPKRRPGRPLEVKVPLEQAESQEEQAIDVYDWYAWLLEEVRQDLDPINEASRLTGEARARATVEAAVELLRELECDQISKFAQTLLDKLGELVDPLAWLDQQLAPWREGLDNEMEELILWAWQRRKVLELAAGEGFPQELRPVVQAFGDALSLFHRSSSLAESFHSWLRPYLQIHRGMPQWLPPLLELYWNHHVFQRGEREGKSPLELAGVEDVPSFSEVLDQLLSSESQDRSESEARPESQIKFESPIRLELQIRVESVQEAVA